MSVLQPAAGVRMFAKSGLSALIRRHPLLAFFAMMYGLTWMVFVPWLLGMDGLGVLRISLPLHLSTSAASIVGLALPALMLTALTGGREGVRQFVRSITQWRVGIRWYLISLVGAPAVYLLGASLFVGAGPLGTVAGQGIFGLTGYFSDVLQRALLVSLWEETGLMAFPFVLLQRRYGAIRASLILGPLWALMHLPTMFIPGMVFARLMPLQTVVVYMLQLMVISLPVRIILTWLFNNTKASILFVALFHSTLDQTTGSIAKLIPSFNPLAGVGLFAVLALLLIVFTRGTLAYKPDASNALAMIVKEERKRDGWSTATGQGTRPIRPC